MAPAAFDPQAIRSKALAEITELMANHPGVTPLRFAKGGYIIKEGQASKNIYIILRGAYVVEKAALLLDQPPSRLAEVHCDPDSFAIVGEMAYIGDLVRSASVIAIEETQALCLKPQHVDAILRECPMITWVIFQQFVQRLKEANRIIMESQTLRELWS